MTWILILWMKTAENTKSVAIDHIEYTSIEACQNAGKEAAKEAWRDWIIARYICTPKSELSPIR